MQKKLYLCTRFWRKDSCWSRAVNICRFIYYMIKITFPDGSVREFESGITPLGIAESISSRLAQDILCASVNDQIVELNYPITEDATIKLHKWEDAEAKHAFWHTSSHLMAEALQELYPGIQFGIGPGCQNEKCARGFPH